MSGRLALILAVLGGTFLALFAMKRDGPVAEQPIRRAAFDLPSPSPEERAAYFLDLLASGKTTRVSGAEVPVWRSVGEPALVEGGATSLDYMLSADRNDSYRQSPDRLTNMLSILPRFDEAPNHPRYATCLQYWLDPDNCAADTPGNHPAEELRKQIFGLFLRVPPLWTVQYAQDELVREDRYHDLRQQALAILLHLGETDAITAAFPSLPPSEEEPDGSLKQFVLFQMRSGASPNQPTGRRDGIRRLEPLARKSLEEGDAIGRINAASTLLRLGDRSMVDVLLDIYAAAASSGEHEVAWSALLQLVADSRAAAARARASTSQRGPAGSAALSVVSLTSTI